MIEIEINWKDYIVADPKVLVGKPTVKGTRLSVEFLLDLLAKGWTKKQMLDNYPSLNNKNLQAVFAFSAECMREETMFAINSL